MTSLSVLALTQIGIRKEICTDCKSRMPCAGGCGNLCETACSVFLLLPRIFDLVRRYEAEPPCGYGFAVRNLLRHAQTTQAVAGGSTDELPLDRHAETTVLVVQQVLSQMRSAGGEKVA